MRKILLALSFSLPLVSHASPIFNIQEVMCSGELSTSGGTLLCGGDLSLRGGAIYSDFSISIDASGVLSMNDLYIRAAGVFLSSGVGLFAGEGVSIESQSIIISGYKQSGEPFPGGVEVIGPGPNVPVVWDGWTITPVPEPSTYSAMLVGLAALGWVSTRRKNA